MMQAADLWNRSDLALTWRLCFARRRRIAIQRHVRAYVVLICKIQSQNSPPVAFAEHDQVTQTLAADGADNSFSVGSLPRRSRRRGDFVDRHAFDAVREIVAVNAFAIAKENTRCLLLREGVADRQLDHSRDSQTQKMRSRGRNFGRFTDCLYTASCWRRARFSIANVDRGTSIPRRKRTHALRTPILAPA